MMRRVGWMFAVVAGLAAAPFARGYAAATTITIVNLDSVGEGLNDPAPVAPVGGNSGTTLGEQRFNALQYAADLWSSVLGSSVEITVGVEFNALSCGATSAVLGYAGTETIHRDFAGAPRAETWYPQALANSLAGIDLDPADDIFAAFNRSIGTTCSFPKTWYYGLDGVPGPAQIDLVTVVLHELGHGLGFISLVGLTTGSTPGGLDEAYMVNLEDHSTGKTYPEMTAGERVAANTDAGDLHWLGASVVAAGSGLTAGRDPISGHVEIYAPNPAIQGSSLSHFSTALEPDEIMEPVYTGASHDVGLAAPLMFDLGWASNACGDGVIDPSEDCDDGNVVGGDGCTRCTVDRCYACAGAPSACTPDDGAPCDDDNPCTRIDTCQAGFCVGDATPLPSCRLPDVSRAGLVLLRDRTPDTKDKLVWKWLKGAATAADPDFGDPTVGTDYVLCVYDAPAGVDRLLMANEMPAGALWTPFSKGFRYKDRNASHDGVTFALLKEGDAGRAKIVVRGKGAGLDMTDLSGLAPPLRVQVSNGTVCWQATYDATVLRSEPELFKARSD